MNILSEKTANLNYEKIKEIHHKNCSSNEKISKIGVILESVFKYMTANDMVSDAKIFDRMKFVFENNNVPSDIISSTHRTRILCNEIRHKGIEANKIDYTTIVAAVAKCINFFSDVLIPPDVECIFNSAIIPSPAITPISSSQPKLKTVPQLTLRQQDLVNNPTPRLPVALLLDTSGSMLIDNRIGELNEGVKLFFQSVLDDEVTRYSVEISIITFGRVVTKVLDFANIERQVNDFQGNMPLTVKNPTDGTPMGEAVELATKILDERKAEYKLAGVEYYQPWLVLMTDGQPTDSISKATRLTSKMVEEERLSLFPIAIGSGANLVELGQFSPTRPPLKLNGLNFREFFEWLKESAKSTSQSTPGQKINFPSIGWGSP